MAVAAETVRLGVQLDCSEIVDTPQADSFVGTGGVVGEALFASYARTINPHEYVLFDDIPMFSVARQQERESAEALLAARRRRQMSHHETAPPPIDPLSTADVVLAAAKRHGEEGEEYKKVFAALSLDCARLFGEWYSKMRPEFFPAVRHTYDVETDAHYSHGLSVRQMMQNALLPIDQAWEQRRRVDEAVEDATSRMVYKLGKTALFGCVIGSDSTESLLENAGIMTISECPDEAIALYQDDVRNKRKHQGYGGYVPEIEKLMIRVLRVDQATGDRTLEQISLPGTYITHDIVKITLEERGVYIGDMDKADLHGSHIMIFDDIMDFVAELDKVASREWCTDVFMGEPTEGVCKKDYEYFKHDAAKRQESLAGYAEVVTKYVLDLARQGVDRRKASDLVEDFVKRLLLCIAMEDETGGLARQMFDEKTAQGLRDVQTLRNTGRDHEARRLMDKVADEAPGGGSCTAGSCGLENIRSESERGELAKKLNAASGDTILRDKERACVNCGKKGIVYAFNSKKVNKLCTACGSFESKKTSAR